MDDLISRQGAITIPILPKEYRKYQTMNLDDAYELGWIDCQKCIEYLPSEERHGRWIVKPHKMMGESPCCSECGSFNPIEYRYCPNCGAKMEEK